MKKIILNILKILSVIAIIALLVLLIIKINNDAKKLEEADKINLNIEAEAQYMTQKATSKLSQIKKEVETKLGKEVEYADIGNVLDIDLYFVVKEGNEYKYVIKKVENEKEVFLVASSPDEEGKYIISLDKIELKDCVYTDIEKYSLDKDGKITYEK